MDEDCYSNSDHNYIYYDVISTTGDAPLTGPTSRDWATRKLNVAKLEDYIDRARNSRSDDWLSDDPNTTAARFHQYVEEGCNISMPSRGYPRSHRPAYWWTDGIAALRRECIHARRLYQRAGRRAVDRTGMREAYKKVKKDLNVAIKTSQEKAWKELVRSVEADSWGLPYKIVAKKLNRKPPGVEAREREMQIAAYLFPEVSLIDWQVMPMGASDVRPLAEQTEAPAPFTTSELELAAKRLPSGKALGSDNVTNEVIKIFIRKDPDGFLHLLNVC